MKRLISLDDEESQLMIRLLGEVSVKFGDKETYKKLEKLESKLTGDKK